jgi:metal transporter CNNM
LGQRGHQRIPDPAIQFCSRGTWCLLLLGGRDHVVWRDNPAGVFLTKRFADDSAISALPDFLAPALFFVAKPTAILLDWWLGVEGIIYLRKRDFRSLVALTAANGGDIGKLGATGVQNFLDLDDLWVTEEGEPVHPQSIIRLPLASGRCVLPTFNPSPDDPFLQRVNISGKKWVIVADLSGEPAFVLDSHHFLRDALFNQPDKNQGACWHRPVIVRDMQTRLGDVIGRLKVVQERPDDDVIDNDLILIWGPQKRIITGSDLLGRLLRGIATVEAGNAAQRLARP